MRTNVIADYRSILQVLEEPGCPFCRFMKNYQSALLQEPSSKEIHHLCSFHTWGLAAIQRASPAAQLLLTMLKSQTTTAPTPSCDICVLLEMEEDRRIREFLSCMDREPVATWLHSPSVICLAHGSKLQRGATPAFAATIQSILDAYRDLLIQKLEETRDSSGAAGTSWGILGHAAEFLVSQRGLRP